MKKSNNVRVMNPRTALPKNTAKFRHFTSRAMEPLDQHLGFACTKNISKRCKALQNHLGFVSMSQVLREAFFMFERQHLELKNGARIKIERPDGEVFYLTFSGSKI